MNSRAHVPSHFHHGLALLLLLLMALLAGGSASRESITVDEVAHIGAGVSYLQKQDLRMNPEHPPLAKALAATPLILRGIRADYSSLPWTFSDNVMHESLGEWVWGHAVALRWNDARSTVFWARVPMILLTLALGLALYGFGVKLGNAWGGLLSLALYASSPTFLAFGPLVITDICVTLFCVLTMWTLASLWRSPGRPAMLRFALAFAGALLSKFSSGLLLFCFLTFVLSLRWFTVADQPADLIELRGWRRLRRRYLWQGIFVAAVIVYVVYLVLSWNQPTDVMARLGSSPAALLLRRLLMPLLYFLGGALMLIVMSSRPTILFGHSYLHGVWFYFPVVFALKTPLAFLVLLVLLAAIALIARRRLARRPLIAEGRELHWRALWVFFSVFVVACLLSRLDLSIRHFTIPVALLILAVAPLPRLLAELKSAGWPAARSASALVAALAIASVVTAVLAYPYYIPFFNSFRLGRPGYALLNDSNLDWNQSLPEAEAYVRQHGLRHVLLAEYGFSDPAVYVPETKFWDCQQPSPGDAGQWAIVSASMIADGHNCLWLMSYPHQALAGGSMYALQLPSPIPSAGAPGGPPLPADFRMLGGGAGGFDIQEVFYDCIRDPAQMQPTFDAMMAEFARLQKKH
jgi:4-amino-4-deoxy-L-arabinose transferase-like glycosyltransferase